MTPEITILKLQIAAATLMGLDYFVPDKYRDIANKHVINYFNGVQGRIDNDINKCIEYIKENTSYLLVGLTCLTFSYVVNIAKNKMHEKGLIGDLTFEIIIILTLPFMILGFVRIFKIFINSIVPVGIGSTIRSVTTFIIKSPKGPISAIGMLCLIFSFYLRYKNIANT